MPNDNPEFTEAQRRHARRIETERELMRTTGKSRSELRQLGGALKERIAQDIAVRQRVSEIPATPKVTSTTTQAAPVDAQAGGGGGAAVAKGGGTGSPGIPVTITLVDETGSPVTGVALYQTAPS